MWPWRCWATPSRPGPILSVLITMLGPISGAQFNPVVMMVLLRRELDATSAAAYVAAQQVGAILGVLIAHAMFNLPLAQASLKTTSSYR